MQQFVVPQFIDVEDKIFGPVTTRQFLILLVGGLGIFISFKLADFMLFVILLILIGGLSLIFAFVKVKGQPFHLFLLNVMQTARKPGLRIWRNTYSKEELEYLRKLNTAKAEEKPEPRKVVRHDRIRDLSLIVNTGGYYRGDDGEF